MSILGKLFIVAVSTVFSLFLAEGGVHMLASAGYMSVPPANIDNVMYAYDADLGYDVVKNFPETKMKIDDVEFSVKGNSLGCADDQYEGGKYALLVGDSFTMHYAPFSQRFGKLLQDYLKERVLTCGVAGYGTKQELLKTQRVIKETGKPPSLIIVGYFFNDLGDDAAFPRVLEQARISHEKNGDKGRLAVSSGMLRAAKDWMTSNSFLLRAFLFSFKSFVGSIPPLQKLLYATKVIENQSRALSGTVEDYQKNEGEAWKEHQANIQAFKEFADAQGSQLLFVLIPWKYQVYDFFFANSIPDPKKRSEFLEYPNTLVSQVLKKDGIAYIDLLPLLKEKANLTPRNTLDTSKDLYYKFDEHWSPLGQQISALMVAKAILSQ